MSNKKNGINKSDKQMEKEAVQDENMSIILIIVILLLCFVVGISLGFGLYKIAINSSNVGYIISGLLR